MGDWWEEVKKGLGDLSRVEIVSSSTSKVELSSELKSGKRCILDTISSIFILLLMRII